MKIFAALAAAILLAAASAGPSGAGDATSHEHHGHRATAPGGSTAAFEDANNKMHAAMAITYTGDADVDFVRGMIPHHQGAIDMAKIALAFGSDPEVRKLAEEIIKAQESEIALMQEWLKKKGQ